MISRRELLGMTVGAGATLALTPELLRAFQKSEGKLLQRAIPSSGEMLPVIGVQFRNNTSQDPAALKEVVKTLLENGGRFLDTMHQSVPGVEDLTAKVVTELGVQEKLFLGLRSLPPGPPQPGADVAKAQNNDSICAFAMAGKSPSRYGGGPGGRHRNPRKSLF